MNEREDFLEEEEDEYEKAITDEVRLRSVNVKLDSVTALLKLFIMPKEERERILQLLIVKVEESRVISVQLRFKV